MTHRKKFMFTLWHVIAIGTLVSAIILVGLVAFWSFQPFGTNVIEFPKGLHVENKTVKAGDSITINAPYCKNAETRATTIARWFQDKLTYYLPAQQGNIPKGCNYNYKSVIQIPENLPTDLYTYNLTFTYELNPIKTVQYTFQTNSFNVIGKEK